MNNVIIFAPICAKKWVQKYTGATEKTLNLLQIIAKYLKFFNENNTALETDILFTSLPLTANFEKSCYYYLQFHNLIFLLRNKHWARKTLFMFIVVCVGRSCWKRWLERFYICYKVGRAVSNNKITSLGR